MDNPSSPAEPARFLFATCQVGAEETLKHELARRRPDFRLAFSRPGFLTFKLPEGHRLPDDFRLRAIFARSHGFSLGKVTGATPEELAAETWRLWGDHPIHRIHVWSRDVAVPGHRGYEPGMTPEALAARAAIRQVCPIAQQLAPNEEDPEVPAKQGDWILDCVLVEPNEWWIGWHRARSAASRWPGGMMPLVLPEHAVSRAWLKMEEALRWSRLPLAAGAQVAEIGSAPGGASQALLDRGCFVTGIDPAEMDPAVLAHPNFRHLRRRAVQVQRREFRKIRWLAADMNVAPAYTLDVVEAVVSHPHVRIRGLLLTLKLFEWEMADALPEHLDRVRRWGYQVVRARQLLHNRQEICVAALRSAASGRTGRRGERPVQ
ncbi:MAG: hypothetical protein JW818_07380 [Pirellulales bacterium]|nr:hypothetical protein [Pirellulales bacterium]